MKETTQRNRRALTAGATVAVLILVLTYGVFPWIELRQEIESLENRLDELAFDESPTGQVLQLRLAKAVPAFETPASEDLQRLRFLRTFTTQVKKAGLGLAAMPSYKALPIPQKDLPVKLLRLECEGDCKLEQAIDVLAGLYENPHLVAAEGWTLQCASEKRDKWRLALTVSTFVK